ncbi:hypothetical protein Tsubulata_014474 [Turnera subulata]|uniref:DUF4283 domain-containing protein n=1 Tax=Turnera subulata TaxID=218843 RepID=A0A9Q0GKN1_9ROSI|nr:hypothetical protein Tsubulata_014474 [Turnera subulata]
MTIVTIPGWIQMIVCFQKNHTERLLTSLCLLVSRGRRRWRMLGRERMTIVSPRNLDSKDEEDDDPYYPTIQLTSSGKRHIYQRWRNTLIIKLLGKKKPRGGIVMADMGNDFYLLQFNTNQDYNRVLCEGCEVTLRYSRVKYARICIEVDLTKPLVSKFRLCRKIWRVVYEGLSTVYFMCGHYGHTLDNCTVNPDPSDVEPNNGQYSSNVREDSLHEGSGSRFTILTDHRDDAAAATKSTISDHASASVSQKDAVGGSGKRAGLGTGSDIVGSVVHDRLGGVVRFEQGHMVVSSQVDREKSQSQTVVHKKPIWIGYRDFLRRR